MPDRPRVVLRAAQKADLPWITQLENRPENTAFVHQWSYREHAQCLDRPSIRYLIAESSQARCGYAILDGVGAAGASIELMRIVVDPPEKGLGAVMLTDIARLAFGELAARSVWLDVYTDNHRAQAVYRRAGYIETDRRCEAGPRPDGGDSQFMVMTLLADHGGQNDGR
jgi:ribosomal protein S18 acetylase RimI-like enzyme